MYKTISGAPVQLTSVDAVSANDAWIGGEVVRGGDTTLKPFVEHWDGARWHPIILPAAAMVRPHLIGAIAASSSRDVWVFGRFGGYAHLRGTHWTAGGLPGTRRGHLVIDLAEALGPGDVWVAGFKITGHSSGFVPYAALFDGTRWRSVALHGQGLFGMSAVSAHDIWAVAERTGTTAPAILRWNGAAWQAEAVQPTLPRHAILETVVAESDHDVWVGGSAPNGQGGTSELALHWDGTSWTTASPPAAPSAASYDLTGLVPDGRGGLWGVGQNVDLGRPPRLWHYSAGAWSPPVKGDPQWTFMQLDWVPRTGSIWAIANSPRLTRGLILLHGPVPR
jgi:hypothetical protein